MLASSRRMPSGSPSSTRGGSEAHVSEAPNPPGGSGLPGANG